MTWLVTPLFVSFTVLYLYSNYRPNKEVVEEDDGDYSSQYYRIPEELVIFDSLPTTALKYKYLKYATGDGSRPTEGICENIKMLKKDPPPLRDQEAYRLSDSLSFTSNQLFHVLKHKPHLNTSLFVPFRVSANNHTRF